MSLALDLNPTKLQIAADYLQVVRNIREENPCSYDVIVKKILAKKAVFQEVCNIEVHNLIIAATSLESVRHV